MGPEVYPTVATKLLPSVEEAIDVQFLIGAVVCDHVSPPFVEVKIGLGQSPPATSRFASAEQATTLTLMLAVFDAAVQLQPPSVEITITFPDTATSLRPSAEDAMLQRS